jgi:nucleoside-triphosphatase THEP1
MRNDPNIVIVTGPVHSGKSTSLGAWAKLKLEEGALIGGILNPSIDGEKWFISPEFNTRRMMSARDNEKDIRVGKYRFSATAFEWAKELLHPTPDVNYDYFIIDEIGKLELKNTGLEPAIKSVFHVFGKKTQTTVIAVVRESLVEQVIDSYNLKNYKVISKDELRHL